MKSINLSGSLRGNVGKSDAGQLRAEGKIPCVLYGHESQTHFWAFAYDLKTVLYTPETYKVHLDIDGTKYEAIVQEAQFHPLNEGILHVDFLALQADKEVKLELPLEFVGTSPGVRAGGKFAARIRKIKVKGLPKDLPASIQVDISELELGKVVRVKDIVVGKYKILDVPNNPIAAVTIPRALKGQMAAESK
jgi:large subunit ribosomal protein L25